MKMSKFSRMLALAAAFLLVVTAFTGCGSTGGGDNPGTSADADKMFNVVLTAPFTGFDPLRTNDSASSRVNQQIYETLYKVKADGTGFDCLLAEELPVFAEDGSYATIKLREGVVFHDGTPFNAEAVKYTLELIADPEFGSLRPTIVSSITSVEVLDDYNIKLNLSYADGVLTAKLAHTNSAIVSPTAQQAQDLMLNPVGTGPYKFVSSVSGSNVVLAVNEEYWGTVGQIKNVTFTVIAEESTAVSRMETGEADFMPQLTVEAIKRVENIQNVTFAQTEAAQIYYLGLRPNSYVNPLMAEKDFRTAIVKAIDAEGYVEFVMENHVTNSGSIVGPKLFGYTEGSEGYGYGFDLEGAKALITENGWENEEITLLVASTPVYLPLGEYIQSNLQAAGFTNVKMEVIDWSAWLTETKVENRFDITIAAWSNVTRDGTELLEPNFHSVNSSKRFFLGDTALDALIEAGKTTADSEKRIENIEAANKLILEEAYAKPLYNGSNMYCYNNAYDNIQVDPSGDFHINQITIK